MKYNTHKTKPHYLLRIKRAYMQNKTKTIEASNYRAYYTTGTSNRLIDRASLIDIDSIISLTLLVHYHHKKANSLKEMVMEDQNATLKTLVVENVTPRQLLS